MEGLCRVVPRSSGTDTRISTTRAHAIDCAALCSRVRVPAQRSILDLATIYYIGLRALPKGAALRRIRSLVDPAVDAWPGVRVRQVRPLLVRLVGDKAKRLISSHFWMTHGLAFQWLGDARPGDGNEEGAHGAMYAAQGSPDRCIASLRLGARKFSSACRTWTP